MREERTLIVCYEVWTGVADQNDPGFGTYDVDLLYDDWTEAATDIKAALDQGRHALVEQRLMTREEFADAIEPSPPASDDAVDPSAADPGTPSTRA